MAGFPAGVVKRLRFFCILIFERPYMSLINTLKHVAWYGTSPHFPHWKNRTIVNTNCISLILTVIIGLMLAAALVAFKLEPGFFILVIMGLINFSVPFLNKHGYTDLSRHLLTFTGTVGILTFAVVRKHFYAPHFAPSLFYQPRSALLIISIIPFIVFHFSERWPLILSMLCNVLALLIFDPLHYLFGVGYYQMGYTEPNYYFANIAYFLYYCFIAGGVGFLKTMMERYEQRNEGLIQKLNLANERAEKQNEQLESKSYILSQLLDKKDHDLTDITEELARYNQELMQYSYTISHNLRGPVTSILGLLELHRLNANDVNRDELLGHMEKTVLNLDHTIRDLNRIVDERQNKFQALEDVDLEAETDRILTLLDDHLRDCGVTVHKHFAVRHVFSVAVRINYILYSLISNAIQYRSPDRTSMIWIRAYREGDNVVIEVRDNGVGIDMRRHQEKLFKPFQRLHPHASGKGLSLYLAKLQAEKMAGKITVESTRDIGTIFKLHLQSPVAKDEH